VHAHRGDLPAPVLGDYPKRFHIGRLKLPEPRRGTRRLYGDLVFEIDTAAMKRDGLTPALAQESDFTEYEAREASSAVRKMMALAIAHQHRSYTPAHPTIAKAPVQA
jgi:hypothetical protein